MHTLFCCPGCRCSDTRRHHPCALESRWETRRDSVDTHVGSIHLQNFPLSESLSSPGLFQSWTGKLFQSWTGKLFRSWTFPVLDGFSSSSSSPGLAHRGFSSPASLAPLKSPKPRQRTRGGPQAPQTRTTGAVLRGACAGSVSGGPVRVAPSGARGARARAAAGARPRGRPAVPCHRMPRPLAGPAFESCTGPHHRPGS